MKTKQFIFLGNLVFWIAEHCFSSVFCKSHLISQDLAPVSSFPLNEDACFNMPLHKNFHLKKCHRMSNRELFPDPSKPRDEYANCLYFSSGERWVDEPGSSSIFSFSLLPALSFPPFSSPSTSNKSHINWEILKSILYARFSETHYWSTLIRQSWSWFNWESW